MNAQIILASGSPRRKELLARLIPTFDVIVADVDEDALTVPDATETATRLAEAKARAVAAHHPGALVIGGDTVVVLPDGRQLAKPKDRDDAIAMLRALSGVTHHVITGVSLVRGDQVDTFHDRTAVTFRALTEDEMAAYVDTGEPMDKAGGYAIQGGAADFISGVVGSTWNVIGLPLEALESHLRTFGGVNL